MVTKKRSGRKAAPRRRVYAARRAAPRRRTNKSGIPMIPGAMATAALVAVNVGNVKQLARSITNDGRNATFSQMTNRTINGFTGANSWVNTNLKKFIAPSMIVQDVVAVGGAYVAGEVIRKYAPGVIKRPLGKIAKKIPKVI